MTLTEYGQCAACGKRNRLTEQRNTIFAKELMVRIIQTVIACTRCCNVTMSWRKPRLEVRIGDTLIEAEVTKTTKEKRHEPAHCRS